MPIIPLNLPSLAENIKSVTQDAQSALFSESLSTPTNELFANAEESPSQAEKPIFFANAQTFRGMKAIYLRGSSVLLDLSMPYEHWYDQIADPVRREARKFWWYPGRVSVSADTSGFAEFKDIKIDIEFNDGKEESDTELYPGFSKAIRISRTDVATNDWWEKFKQEFPYDKEFHEYSFATSIPYNLADTKDETKNVMNVPVPVYADVTPDYTFYDSIYEKAQEKYIDNALPNMYMMLEDSTGDVEDKSITENNTKGGRLPSLKNKYEAKKNPYGGKADKNQSSSGYKTRDDKDLSYFTTHSIEMDLLGEIENVNGAEYTKKAKTLVFPHTALDVLEKYEGHQYMFPMFVQNTATLDDEKFVSSFFSNVDLSTNLMARVYAIKHSENEIGESFQKFMEEKYTQTFNTREGLNFYSVNGLEMDNEALKKLLNESIVFNKESVISEDSSQYKLFSPIFTTRLNSYIRDRLLGLEDICNGELCYNEVLFYRIAKYVKSSGEKLQDIYISASSTREGFNYYDTQVKYAKDYNYRIYAYKLVVGTKYKYVKKFESNLEIIADVIQQPEFKIIEVPIYEEEAVVLDKPPLAPNVTFNVYKNVKDSILIRMSPSYGTIKTKPIMMSINERDEIYELRKAQKEGTEITFKGDDRITSYEIRRKDSPPKSYFDFTDQFYYLNHKISAAVDVIQPNKKYYYAIRCNDIHRHFSNPTEIYEVELINEDGASYLSLNIFDIDKYASSISEKRYVKNMRKFLRIKAASNQVLINATKSGYTEQTPGQKSGEPPVLGVEASSVFDTNRKFKIRIRSKHSGKTIELNLNFDKAHLKPEEDEANVG